MCSLPNFMVLGILFLTREGRSGMVPPLTSIRLSAWFHHPTD